MRSISILNFKGGTGKSSLAENLSYALAARGRRVLVIDCDRQANASTTLLGAPQQPTLKHVIRGETTLRDAIREARPGLFVVPADTNLDEASAYIPQKRANYLILSRAIATIADAYDYVFFDHAGAYTPVMETALLASAEMLIPCELEAYAVQGLFSMFAKLGETLADHEIRNAGIIPYNVDVRYAMAKQYLLELREQFGDLITPPIRTDSLVPKAQSVQLTVMEYAQEYKVKSRAAEDFVRLAAFIENGGQP